MTMVMTVHVEEIFDDWELPEVRDRDPVNWPGQKADCCTDRMRFVAEIPRVRLVAGSRFEYAPARFRLCRHHAEILHRVDVRARIYAIPDRI